MAMDVPEEEAGAGPDQEAFAPLPTAIELQTILSRSTV
jgi:hypothetical protein